MDRFVVYPYRYVCCGLGSKVLKSLARSTAALGTTISIQRESACSVCKIFGQMPELRH
jgi:hypothetical protein